MKIDEAIGILELNLKQTGKAMPPDCHNAVQLGLEALKNKLEARRYGIASSKILLPGETE